MTILQQNRELLAEFRQGKKEALHAVYRHYCRDIERFIATGWISRKTGKYSRIQLSMDTDFRLELIQEVFLRAFSKNARQSYDGLRSYRNYLLTLARNVVVDYIRSRPNDALAHYCTETDVNQICEEQATSADYGDPVPGSPEEVLNWQRCIRAMRVYVTGLSEKEKRFIDMRYRQEFSLLEVARKLDISRGKARHMEKQLGKGLKQYLEERNLSIGGKNEEVTTNLNKISVSTV